MIKECIKCLKNFEPTKNQIKKSDYRCNECVNAYKRVWDIKNKLRPDYKPTDWSKYYGRYKDNRNYKGKYIPWDNLSPENRLKKSARYMANYALKKGLIIKKSCEINDCIQKAEMHHDDYYKPLEVRWVCRKHHRELHKKIK